MNVVVVTGPRGGRWRCETPTTRRERMRGLRARDRLPADRGMWLPRCRSVHTLGMQQPLTVAFLDREHQVLEVKRVPAGRPLVRQRTASSVLELPVGADVRRGDLLRVEPAS